MRIGHFADNDRINGIDTVTLSLHAGYMTDQIKEHEELLREEASVAKADTADEVKEQKESIRELKGLLAKCKDPAERAEIEAEIQIS